MPYSLKSPPSVIKNLPKGAQKIWIDTFNGVVNSGKSEEEARKAAWHNTKLKYKKVGGKWVRKSKNSTEGLKLHITNTSGFVNLVEGEDGNSKAVYRVIKPGWSQNGFYYPKDVTPQLVPFIESKPMFFADHLEPKEKKDMIFGQKLKSAVAIAERAWADDTGEVFVELRPVGNPDTAWIWEAAQNHSEHIGNSIDAYGKVVLGEKEGKKGKVVEEFVGYDSTDFVYRPSAGGKFISLTEATNEDGDIVEFGEEDNTSETISLEEAVQSFKEYLDQLEKKSMFWRIATALVDFLFNQLAYNNSMSEEEKTDVFNNALKEFEVKLREIDPTNLFNASYKEEPFMFHLQQLGNKLEEAGNMDPKDLQEAIKAFTPESLKVSFPDLYEAVVSHVRESLKTEDKVQEASKLQAEVNDLLTKVKTLTDERDTLKTEKEKSEAELSKIKEAEEERQWKDKVEELIEKSGLSTDFITETFKTQLLESDSEEKVEKLLEDRLSIVKPKDPGFDNGKKKAINEKEELLVLDDDSLAQAIRKRN